MYIIQTDTICDGWVNTWSTDGVPTTYKTAIEAQNDLNDFFFDMDAEYRAGNFDSPIDRSEYRIHRETI